MTLCAPALIVVEGAPGCGKSTTAQRLSIELSKSGFKSRFLHEDESDNPVREWYDPEKFNSPDHYRTHTTAAWNAFIAQVNSGDTIYVLDGCLFQTTFFGLLWHDLDEAIIRDTAYDLLNAFQRARVVLVSLYSSSIRRTLTEAYGSRYESLLIDSIVRIEKSTFCRNRKLNGIDALVRFWTELRRLADPMIQDFSGPHLALNVSKRDLNEANQVLAEYFELPPFEPGRVLEDALKKYVGAYSRNVKGGRAEFHITFEDGYLVVAGLAPFLWDAGNRLIPKREHIFYAQAWPTEAVFEVGEDGAIKNLRLESRDRGWRSTREIFPKVL